MASKETEERLRQKYEAIAADRAEAAVIRDVATANGTWGVKGGSATSVTTTPVSSATVPATPTQSSQKITVAQQKESATEKKEESKEAPSKKDAAKTTMEQAVKAYDDYIKSDEHKQRMQEAENKARLDAAVQATVNHNFDMMTPQMIRDEKAEQLRAARDQAEADYNRSLDEEVMAADQAAIADLTDEERSILEQYAVNRIGDQNRTLEMQGIMPTAQQQASALIQKYGQQRVDELAESLMRQQNADLATQLEEESRQFADEHGFLGSALTVPVAAMNGPAGTLGHLQGAARSTGRYRTLDANETGTLGDVFTGAVRGQVQQNIEGEDPNLLQKAASVGYQGVMSMADSIARGFLGGGPIGAGVLAATSTFSQVMSEASRNGATPAQAAALATVNSAIEAATEAIPLDELIKTAKGQGAGTVLKNVLRNAGIEATAEELSLVGTFLAEAAIMQEQSGYQQEVRDLILGGMSPEAARETANRNLLNEAVNTAFVAGLSGGLSSVGASVADAKSIPTPPTIEQVADMVLGDLVKPQQAVQEQSAPVVQQGESVAPEAAAQPAQGSENGGNDVLMRTMELMAGNDGKLSNKAAENILHDPDAIGRIMEQTGTDITGTKSEQRAKLKAAMEQMFQNQNTEADTQVEIPATEAQAQAPQVAQQTETVQPQAQAPQQQTPVEAPTAAQQGSTPQVDTYTGVQMSASNVQEQSPESGQQEDGSQQPVEMQRDRVNAVREQAVPVTDPKGGKVSEFVGNAYQSSLTPDAFTDSISSLVSEGRVSHDVQTNQQSLEKGAQLIADAGSERKAVNNLRDYANSGKTSPEHIAMGTVLYQDLTSKIEQQREQGKVDPNLERDAEEVFVSLQQMATNSGRALQLFNLFRKMSPESQANVLRDEVQRNVESLQKNGAVKKGYQAEIDPQLMDSYKEAAMEYQNAKDEKAKQTAEQKMQEIQNEIYLQEAAKLPTTFKAKWDAWRYMAMLGNVKTQLRNVLGNALMMPYTAVKRKVGAIMEKGIAKENRTKSITQDKDMLRWAAQDAKSENVNSALERSSKLGDSSPNKLADNMKTFGTSWVGERMNDLQGIINKAVQGGDLFFKNQEYVKSLAGFLKARGYTAADLQTEGAVPVEVMNEARNYAINEAMKATFNDSNSLSDALSGLRYTGDNKAMKALSVLGEGVMPFRKTPANVVVRFKDYSPAGLAQGVWNMAANVRNGKVSAATAIDQISGGLTGTGVMMLGYALAGGIAGVKLTGSGADEDEKRQGHQNYALEFSVNGETYSYTIDWASPANLPLFLGANLRSAWESDDTASFYTAVMNMGMGALEPLLELSCMSSLNDLVEGVRYADEGEGLYTLIASAATSYFTQGVPSVFRQATQALTPDKQTTLVTSDDPVVQKAQKFAAGLGVGNPYKTDKVNAWGEKETTENDALRAFNAFFNPGTLKKVDNSDLENEITRLNEKGLSVSPNTAPKVVVYQDKNGDIQNDVRLTEEQYQTLAQTQGETARRILEKVVKSDVYKTMTDAQKADTLRAVYDYARQVGMDAALDDYDGMDTWAKDLTPENELNAIMNRQITSTFTQAFDGLTDDYKRGNDTAQSLKELEQAYSNYSVLPREEKQQFMQDISGRVKYYVQARNLGVNSETFSDLYKKYRNIEGMNKEISEKAQLWSYMLEKAVDDGTITERQKDNLKQNMQYRYSFAAETEKFDEMIEAGVGTDSANRAVYAVKNAAGTGENGAVRDIDKRGAIADLQGVSDAEKDAIMKAYMTDYDPNAKSPQTTELKYDYARQELGLTPQEYVDVYTVQLDGGKKAQKLDKWEAMGYTPEQAKMFYRLFSATGRTKIDVEEWYRSILQ